MTNYRAIALPQGMRGRRRRRARVGLPHRASDRLGVRLACVGLAFVVASCGSSRQTPTRGAVAHRTGHTLIVSVPWRFQSIESRRVRLSWIGGGCLTPARTRVVEARRSVEIPVLAREYMPGPGEACTADARFYTVQIHLRDPLGHRKLLHAPLTPEAP
jgi:hypothetical protein